MQIVVIIVGGVASECHRQMPNKRMDKDKRSHIFDYGLFVDFYHLHHLLHMFTKICTCKCFWHNAITKCGVVVVGTPTQIQSALAAFETLTSIPYEANANEEENSCAICLDPIENGTMVKPLPCKHIFYNKCIYSWIKQHITCPMCRDALSMTKAVRVSSNGQANGATNGNGGGSARGTATVANPREVVIDMPSADGQNGENAVGTGTDGAEINRHNNGTENGPN
ncbi:hypothetical protein niasHT_031408 [Heterodera trifolii]|uniref:RING-type domain-containing protein n=1 Tax=Heterodera trifolii TaxID=157864 RepID=A0ABD2HY31_9BILA